jgi:hypothetical protein
MGIWNASTIAKDSSKEPWMRRRDWASGNIRDGVPQYVILLWIVTLIWIGITYPLFSNLKSHTNLIFALIWTIIDVCLLILAIRSTLRIMKFGKSVLALQTLPANPGGSLSGTIHVTRTIVCESTLQLKLMCINQVTQSSGNTTTVTETVLWQDSQTLDQFSTSRDGSDIPVFFNIPVNARECDYSRRRNIILWRVEAKAKTAGVDYLARFDIPVFIKPKS